MDFLRKSKNNKLVMPFEQRKGLIVLHTCNFCNKNIKNNVVVHEYYLDKVEAGICYKWLSCDVCKELFEKNKKEYFKNIANSVTNTGDVKNIGYPIIGLPLQFNRNYYDNDNMQLEIPRNGGYTSIGYLVSENIYYENGNWNVVVNFEENKIVYEKRCILCELVKLNDDLIDMVEILKISYHNKNIYKAIGKIIRNIIQFD